MFGFDVLFAAKAHALHEWPRECVGYVVRGKYQPQFNIAARPDREFAVDAGEWSEHVQAVIHSHSVQRIGGQNDQRCPSKADMLSQYASAVPWGILAASNREATDILWFGDHVLDEPLIGRKFIANVMDCYELMRAYRHQNGGRALPPVPREVEWWNRGEDVLYSSFRKLGFLPVQPELARAGDGLLIAIPPRGVMNHCAVLLENGLMLHHRFGELSRREPWSGPWRRLTQMVIRDE